MTQPAQIPSIVYTGNSITTVFPFDFFIGTGEASVWLLDSDTEVATELALGVDFSIPNDDFDDVNGGNVTYPVVGSAIHESKKLIIARATDISQILALPAYSAYYPQRLESALDRIIRVAQEHQEQFSRALLVPRGSTTTPASLIEELLNGGLPVDLGGLTAGTKGLALLAAETERAVQIALLHTLISVETIVALNALMGATLLDGQVIWLHGGTTAADSKEGFLVFSLASVVAADNAIVFATADNLGRLIRQEFVNKREIQIRWWGIDETGVVDSYPACAAAHAAFLGIGGGRASITLPAGNFTLGTHWALTAPGLKLDGMGRGGMTILRGSHNEGPVVSLGGIYQEINGIQIDASNVSGSAITFTVAIANPAVVTKTAHGFIGGEAIRLETTGALPTGLGTSGDYWVLSTSLTADTFRVSRHRGGSAITTTGSQSGVHTYKRRTGRKYGAVNDSGGLPNIGLLATASDFKLGGIRVLNQPNDGVLVAGLAYRGHMPQTTVTACEGHGIVIDPGDEYGITPGTPGLHEIIQPTVNECTGHAIVIGRRTGTFLTAIRVVVRNLDSADCATDSTKLLDPGIVWIRAFNSTIEYSAIFATVSNMAMIYGQSCLACNFISNRFFPADATSYLYKFSGPTTEGVLVDGIDNAGTLVTNAIFCAADVPANAVTCNPRIEAGYANLFSTTNPQNDLRTITGWVRMTGTADNTTAFPVASASTANVAARLKAIEDLLATRGYLGA